MTSTLIPIPESAEFWYNKLFYLHTPIVLMAEEFDTYWPLISTVYTKLSGLYITAERRSYSAEIRVPIKKK